MKNNRPISIALTVIFAASFLSCEEDPSGSNNRPTAVEVALVSGIGNFWGDYYADGVSNFDLDLHSVALDGCGDPVGDGYNLYVDFFSENPTKDFPPDIAPGRYEAGNMTKFTCLPGKMGKDGYWSYSLVLPIENGDYGAPIAVTGGYFDVTSSAEGHYRISFDLKLADGTAFKAVYDGAIGIRNRMYVTDLVEDLDIGRLTGTGIAGYAGTNKTGAHEYSLIMLSENINVEESSGTGDMMWLTICSATGGTIALPTGTYPVDYTGKAGTALGAGGSMRGITGGWYCRVDDGYISKMAPVVSGEVAVSMEGNIYTVTFTGKDDYGHSITGSYEGAFRIDDLTLERTRADSVNFLERILQCPDKKIRYENRNPHSRKPGICRPRMAQNLSHV
jgi:hypothetical protein